MSRSELSDKVLYAGVRHMVFERLGTLRRDVYDKVTKDLTPEEKLQFADALINYVSDATDEFVTEMKNRLEKEREKITKKS